MDKKERFYSDSWIINTPSEMNDFEAQSGFDIMFVTKKLLLWYILNLSALYLYFINLYF